jgi:hypothetical protein
MRTGDSKELEAIKKHASELGEYYDAVSIFVSQHEEGEERGTVHLNSGCGNYFARVGHVRDWLIKEEEATRIGQRDDDE